MAFRSVAPLLGLIALLAWLAVPTAAADGARSTSSGVVFGPTRQVYGPFWGQHGTFFLKDCQGGPGCAAEVVAVDNNGVFGRGSDDNPATGGRLSGPFYGQLGTYADTASDTLYAVNRDGVYSKQWLGGFQRYGRGLGPTVRATTTAFYGNLATAFADVNGDGIADAIAVNSSGVFVKLGRFDGTFGYTRKWTNAPFYGTRGTYFADVNGDKKADAIVVNATGTTVHLSTGAAFAAKGPTQKALTASSQLVFGPIANADPRAAAVWFSPTRVYVYPSTTAGFGAPQAATSSPYFGDVESALAQLEHGYGFEAVVVDRSGIYVKRG